MLICESKQQYDYMIAAGQLKETCRHQMEQEQNALYDPKCCEKFRTH